MQHYIKIGIADREQEPRRNYGLVVVLSAGNRLIGGCSMRILNLENRDGEIGCISNRDFWGQGDATEMATALLGFGFDQLN